MKRKTILFAAALAVCIGAALLAVKGTRSEPENISVGITRQVSAEQVTLYSPKNEVEIHDDFVQEWDQQVYLSEMDLRHLSLDSQPGLLNRVRFDTNTLWPETLPEGFDPDALMELGKNPGLGIRELHQQGIDGSGVAIAVIDQTLLTGHEQYRDNLVHYEELYAPDFPVVPQMHGAAVASLAVGKDTGVAPGADLYYFGVWYVDEQDEVDLDVPAQAIDRIIAINKQLPEGEKIRVISLSLGIEGEMFRNQEKFLAAIQRAKGENIFVITSDVGLYYDFEYNRADREAKGDPDSIECYTIGIGISDMQFFNEYKLEEQLYIPADSRTYASHTGESAYEYARVGGMSWATPYLAGLYALACQVDADMTPERFITAATDTAHVETRIIDGQPHQFKIINPAGLIEAVS